MSKQKIGNTFGKQTRRDFLATAGAAAGAAALWTPQSALAAPKRGGTLRFSTRSDSRGLDPHRNIIYYVSHPLAGISQGLLDLDLNMEIVPGIGEEWSISDDLTTYTVKIRKGVEYHNGRTIDAESVKWNYERILDPKSSHGFHRSTLQEIKEIIAVDKTTLRIILKGPSAAFLANITYYPCNLIAPDSVEQVDTHPIGCGPFKFKSWKRYTKTELVRFENYFETDAAGNNLPYLDAIEGFPKKEDKVRLTALRAGEVDLIENMSYSDVDAFKKKYSATHNTCGIPQVGTGYLAIQAKQGPFAMDKADGKMLRQAVAHAIDKEAIHQAVFNGLSEKLTGFYASTSPWHMPGIQNVKEFDPEKSKFILRKLNALGTPIAGIARNDFEYMHNSAELVYSMLQEAGFKPTNEVFDNPVIRQKFKKNDYGIESTANAYRFEPDGWYSRNILSTAPEVKIRTGYVNLEADKLIIQARATREKSKRIELYTAVESMVNDDCVNIYTHCIPLTTAATKNLKGYTPAIAGPFSTSGAGIRTAYFA